jgi:hypothetical protein
MVTLKMNFLNLIIILFFISGSVGCRGIEIFMIVGKTEIQEERSNEGVLIKRTKIKKRTNTPFYHPHNASIIITKTWIFRKGKLIEFAFEKRKRTMIDWNGKVLKSKKKIWTDNGHRIN